MDHLRPLTDAEHEDVARQGARELAAERSSLRAENAALRAEVAELRARARQLWDAAALLRGRGFSGTATPDVWKRFYDLLDDFVEVGHPPSPPEAGKERADGE